MHYYCKTGMVFAVMQKSHITLLPIFILLLLCPSCSEEKPTVVIHPKNNSAPLHISVELAQTAGQRAMGLMYRKRLGKTRGMLFLFEREQQHKFTMHNTAIALDMIFIDSSRTIAGIVKNTKPYANGPFNIKRSSQYVLEVNAGFCDHHGIASGDKVEFPNLPIQKKH